MYMLAVYYWVLPTHSFMEVRSTGFLTSDSLLRESGSRLVSLFADITTKQHNTTCLICVN